MFASRISNSAPIQALVPENPPDWTSYKRRNEDPPVNLMEIFYALDDDTLQWIFKMGSLMESELRNIAGNGVTEVGIAEDSASGNIKECHLDSRLTGHVCRAL